MKDADVLDGYRRFRSKKYPKLKRLYQKLAKKGQKPPALVIGCSDSRVPPTLLFDAGPGELFRIHNVANIVPVYSQDREYAGFGSALEFAVTVLEVSNIILMGHEGCGGMDALLKLDRDPSEDGSYIERWIYQSVSARDKVMEDHKSHGHDVQLKALEEENVRLGLVNLMTYPWVKERVDAGKLRLVGGRFELTTGILSEYDEAAGKFLPVK